MALSPCGALVTDDRGRELAAHGTSLFPVACYHDCVSQTPVPWHWHEELEALVVTAGTARVTVNGTELVIRPGEGVFINAGAIHGCHSAGEDECLLRSLVFHPRLVGGSVDSILWQKYVEPLVSASGPAWVCLRGAAPWEREAAEAISLSWELCVAEGDGFEFAVRGQLSRLVFLLRQNCPVPDRPLPQKARREGERVKLMLQYIQRHLGEALTLDGIARSANLSKNECLRCFRNILGCSPIRYVQELRVQQAAERLLRTEESISEIAAACGFQEMSYFAKLFRRLNGCTPSAYRKRGGTGEKMT